MWAEKYKSAPVGNIITAVLTSMVISVRILSFQCLFFFVGEFQFRENQRWTFGDFDILMFDREKDTQIKSVGTL